jgi:hypothetical protein
MKKQLGNKSSSPLRRLGWPPPRKPRPPPSKSRKLPKPERLHRIPVSPRGQRGIYRRYRRVAQVAAFVIRIKAANPRDTVDIPNSAAFTAGRINGKRLHVDRRARVATRQALSGAGVKVTRLRGVLWIRHRTSNHVHVFSS